MVLLDFVLSLKLKDGCLTIVVYDEFIYTMFKSKTECQLDRFVLSDDVRRGFKADSTLDGLSVRQVKDSSTCSGASVPSAVAVCLSREHQASC